MESTELWKPIINFTDSYEVSNHGRVISYKKILQIFENYKGNDIEELKSQIITELTQKIEPSRNWALNQN